MIIIGDKVKSYGCVLFKSPCCQDKMSFGVSEYTEKNEIFECGCGKLYMITTPITDAMKDFKANFDRVEVGSFDRRTDETMIIKVNRHPNGNVTCEAPCCTNKVIFQFNHQSKDDVLFECECGKNYQFTGSIFDLLRGSGVPLVQLNRVEIADRTSCVETVEDKPDKSIQDKVDFIMKDEFKNAGEERMMRGILEQSIKTNLLLEQLVANNG